MEKKLGEGGNLSDASWLIALWKYIHGGDPGPSDQIVAANILASMAEFLHGKPVAISSSTLQSKFREMEGLVTVKRHTLSEDSPDVSAKVALALEPSLGPGFHCCQYEEICIGTGHKKVCHQVCVEPEPKGVQCQ